MSDYGATTLDDLHAELKQSYCKYGTVAHMKQIANWSGLCEKESLFAKWNHFRRSGIAGSFAQGNITSTK